MTGPIFDLGYAFLVHLEEPVGHIEGQPDHPADGQPAGDLAGGMAAHAVGHDHQVVDLVGTLRHVASRETGEHGFQ